MVTLGMSVPPSHFESCPRGPDPWPAVCKPAHRLSGDPGGHQCWAASHSPGQHHGLSPVWPTHSRGMSPCYLPPPPLLTAHLLSSAFILLLFSKLDQKWKFPREPKQQAQYSNLKEKDPLPTTEFKCMGFVKTLFRVCVSGEGAEGYCAFLPSLQNRSYPRAEKWKKTKKETPPAWQWELCQFISLQHFSLGGALYYYLAYFPQMCEIQKKKKKPSTAINTLTGRLWWSRLWVVQSHRKRSEGLPASGTMLPKASRDELPTRYLIFRSDIETPKLKKKSKFLKTKISKFF